MLTEGASVMRMPSVPSSRIGTNSVPSKGTKASAPTNNAAAEPTMVLR